MEFDHSRMTHDIYIEQCPSSDACIHLSQFLIGGLWELTLKPKINGRGSNEFLKVSIRGLKISGGVNMRACRSHHRGISVLMTC